MGQEIDRSEFSVSEQKQFLERLQSETATLDHWFHTDAFDRHSGHCGFELEGWLVGRDYRPAAENERFLKALDDPLVVPELSKFNFELNSKPHIPDRNVFKHMHRELRERWERCVRCASTLGLMPVQIGTLPTLRDDQLTMANISPLQRYFALNKQILQQRQGTPLRIDISGDREQLQVEHRDVMTESATTSLQIHLQVNVEQAVRFYNASQIAAAPMVALCANSPFLFGKQLWEETRIPLFEQSVSAPAFYDRPGHIVDRVTFGTRYTENSLMEIFEENLSGFPVLLPMLFENAQASLDHLRLHNGTIWRWNRPLIGFNSDGTPHLRLEHRVASAGPSVPDVIANIAFYYGLVHWLANNDDPPETLLPFAQARANFYQAARHGFDTDIFWLDGREHSLRRLLLDELLPAARQTLTAMGVDRGDVDYYYGGILEPRVRGGQNGARWQKRFIGEHGPDFALMTRAYCERQNRHIPVHEWTV